MISRGYHDSGLMARIAPVGMVFIPCRCSAALVANLPSCARRDPVAVSLAAVVPVACIPAGNKHHKCAP